ncbi:MAG: hypothetical protein ABW110_03750 [Steroidobacteraceae bacterium]
MSALPSVVRKQVEAANQVAKEYYDSLKTPDGAPPSGEPPAGGTPPTGAAPTPPVEPPDPTPPAAEGWEQKYRVLQGKYNAEVPRLTRTVQDQSNAIRDLQASLTTTQNLLASLSAQRGNAPAGNEPAAPSAQPARLVKDEEVKEFGADLIDVMRRVAREEGASLLPQIDQRIAPVKQRADAAAKAAGEAATKVAANDQQSVMQQLADKVPNWEELNVDQGFLDWLDQRDPFSGAVRGLMLKQAFEAHDGPRVVNFFLGYQKEHAVVTPPPADATPPATPPAQPQRSLEQLVAPGAPKTGAASTPNGSGKRVWTRAEIGLFYKDLGAGKYRGKTEEAKKIEADIFVAQREGRIR